MDEQYKAEWIEERTAIIMEGCGLPAEQKYQAQVQALKCWESMNADPQGRLF